MKTYRVVETANPLVSPFPSHTWPTRGQAERFANVDAPNGWVGKLTVIESDDGKPVSPVKIQKENQ